MKQVSEGTQLKINKTIYTVIKIDGPYAIIRTSKGGQFCYGMSGIRQSQILEYEPGTQPQLL